VCYSCNPGLFGPYNNPKDPANGGGSIATSNSNGGPMTIVYTWANTGIRTTSQSPFTSMAMGSDGNHLIVATGGAAAYPVSIYLYSGSWILNGSYTSSPPAAFAVLSVACTPGFDLLAAATDNTVYVLQNTGGGSWGSYFPTGTGSITSVAVAENSSGPVVAVATDNGNTYLGTTNAGVFSGFQNENPLATGQTISGSASIASNTNGSLFLAAVNNGDVFNSTNGINWTNLTNSNASLNGITAVASDGSGNNIAALQAGSIWIGSNVTSMLTWTQKTIPGAANLSCVAHSTNGSVLVAAENPGYIYVSTDGGNTWSKQVGLDNSGNGNWVSVAANSDGTRISAASSTEVWYGTTP